MNKKLKDFLIRSFPQTTDQKNVEREVYQIWRENARLLLLKLTHQLETKSSAYKETMCRWRDKVLIAEIMLTIIGLEMIVLGKQQQFVWWQYDGDRAEFWWASETKRSRAASGWVGTTETILKCEADVLWS